MIGRPVPGVVIRNAEGLFPCDATVMPNFPAGALGWAIRRVHRPYRRSRRSDSLDNQLHWQPEIEMRNTLLWITLTVSLARGLFELSYGRFMRPGIVWDMITICSLSGMLLAS